MRRLRQELIAAAPILSVLCPLARCPVSDAGGLAASGPGPTPAWAWALAGTAAVVGVSVRIARSHGQRFPVNSRRALIWGQHVPADDWQSRLIDACGRASALHDAIRVAQGVRYQALEDADAGWLDVQRRAGDLAQTLSGLRESAPGEDERANVTNVLDCLEALRSAMAAEHAPYAFGSRQAENLRSHLLALEISLCLLRAPDEPLP